MLGDREPRLPFYGISPCNTTPKESDVTFTSRLTNRTLMFAALVATIALMLVAIAAGTNGAAKPGAHSKIELAGKTVSSKPSRRA